MCRTAVNVCIELRLWSALYKTVFECFKRVGQVSPSCHMLTVSLTLTKLMFFIANTHYSIHKLIHM